MSPSMITTSSWGGPIRDGLDIYPQGQNFVYKSDHSCYNAAYPFSGLARAKQGRLMKRQETLQCCEGNANEQFQLFQASLNIRE